MHRKEYKSMGTGLIVKCNTCKFKESYHLGAGMMFPNVYKNLVEEVRSGRYGKEWREFFEENDGAAINAEKQLYQCPSCNRLKLDYDKSLYKSKSNTPPEDGYWCYWRNPCNEYKLFKRFIHYCPKCKIEMRRIEICKDTNIPCPRCGNELTQNNNVSWD